VTACQPQRFEHGLLRCRHDVHVRQHSGLSHGSVLAEVETTTGAPVAEHTRSRLATARLVLDPQRSITQRSSLTPPTYQADVADHLLIRELRRRHGLGRRHGAVGAGAAAAGTHCRVRHGGRSRGGTWGQGKAWVWLSLRVGLGLGLGSRVRFRVRARATVRN